MSYNLQPPCKNAINGMVLILSIEGPFRVALVSVGQHQNRVFIGETENLSSLYGTACMVKIDKVCSCLTIVRHEIAYTLKSLLSNISHLLTDACRPRVAYGFLLMFVICFL